MKTVKSLFFVLAICSLVTQAWSGIGRPTGRIVDGYNARSNNHPFMISLQIKLLWVRAHFCGGSLVTDNWVITAGHCIKGSWLLRILPIVAVAGAQDVDQESPTVQVIKVDKSIPHPKFEGGIGPYDIGLVRTQYPFQLSPHIQPIGLSATSKILDKPLVLFGWGLLKTIFFFPIMPSQLQEVQLEYIPHKECYDTLDRFLEYHETNPLDSKSNICAGPTKKSEAACEGDSGGPLIQYKLKNLKPESNITDDDTVEEDNVISTDTELGCPNTYCIPVLIGVVSWGVTPCGEDGAPTVFTNITDNLDFILETINMN